MLLLSHAGENDDNFILINKYQKLLNCLHVCCSQYNACSDWLILGQCSLIIPMANYGRAKTKQRVV